MPLFLNFAFYSFNAGVHSVILGGMNIVKKGVT